MKKIIEGKMYNTETAVCLGSYDNGCAYTDFRFCEESLYRTKKGAFFIAGRGGPMTHYARSCGDNNWCGGKDLRAVTEQEARDWMEQHCDAANYIAAFGQPEEA